MMSIKKKQLAKMIDHTLLKPSALRNAIVRLCDEAKSHGFATVCINPTYVSLASKLLRGSDVKVCTVIGFPLGANISPVKAYEAERAIADGAEELDMVINIGAVKSGDLLLVKEDIAAVLEVARRGNVILKVIIETCYLSDEEKVQICQLILDLGCDFVKTSTGFGDYGAKVEDVQLLRKIAGTQMGVKAAGGIRTYEDALKMINAGASRLGASTGIRILEGCPD
jgi:deoxyribose-phosphate aldolase